MEGNARDIDPPSITFIIYGVATETSIGKLFIAGVIPGILITILFSLWLSSRRSGAGRNPGEGTRLHPAAPSPGSATRGPRSSNPLPKVVPFVLLIALIMGSIYGGISTPSEAAAIGAAASIVLVLVFYRRTLTFKSIVGIMQKTVNESAMIMLIAATAVFFQSVLTDLNITQQAVGAIVTLESNRWLVMILINLLLLLLGCFLPPFAIILLTAPLLHPIILKLGFDPVWFGVIVTINMEAGCITPALRDQPLRGQRHRTGHVHGNDSERVHALSRHPSSWDRHRQRFAGPGLWLPGRMFGR